MYEHDTHPKDGGHPEAGCPRCHSARVIGLSCPGRRACQTCGLHYGVDDKGAPILQVAGFVEGQAFRAHGRQTPRSFCDLVAVLVREGWVAVEDDPTDDEVRAFAICKQRGAGRIALEEVESDA